MTWSATLLPARGRRATGLGGWSISIDAGPGVEIVARRERVWEVIGSSVAGFKPEELGFACNEGNMLPRLRGKVPTGALFWSPS